MSSSSRKKFLRAAPTANAIKIVDANPGREQLTLRNVGSITVWLGKDATVTPTRPAFPIEPGEIMIDTASADAYWGITASDTGDIAGIEVS